MDLVNLFAVVLNFFPSFYLGSQYLGFNFNSSTWLRSYRLNKCCLYVCRLDHAYRGLVINKLKGPLDTVHFPLHSVSFSLDAHLLLLFLFRAQERELKELLSNLDVILVFFLSLIWMQDIEQKLIASSI